MTPIMIDRAWRAFHRSSSVDAALTDGAPGVWVARQRKCYRRFDHIPLRDAALPTAMLAGVLNARRTTYAFEQRADDVVLATLCSSIAERGAESRRPYPSAGALYAVELYFLAPYDLSDDLRSGKYRELERLDSPLTPDAVDAAFGQSFTLANALTLVLTAVVERSYRKYRERAYRYCLLEAGHIAQTWSLTAAALDLCTASLGGFRDVQLADELYLRTDLEVPVYAVAVG
jgi:SagB-type dehydrogenase family enzyme